MNSQAIGIRGRLNIFVSQCVWGSLLIISLLLSQESRGDQKSKLSECFVFGVVRVFYATEGESAIDPADLDESGIPDRVEDVARQIWAARKLFCEVLGFPDPFDSPRFVGANCIQVSLLDRSRIKGMNGVAYRVAQTAKAIPEGRPGDRSLVIAVATTVDATSNATPAHEFFHLIQYGSTYLSNRWFLEGMARWSEQGLGKGGIGKKRLSSDAGWPQNVETRKRLFAMSYDAAQLLWNPLAEIVDSDRKLAIQDFPADLTTLSYSDGGKVLKDDLFSGAALMRDILIELNKADDQVMADLGYEEWTLENQGNEKNDDYLYDAVMKVHRRAR